MERESRVWTPEEYAERRKMYRNDEVETIAWTQLEWNYLEYLSSADATAAGVDNARTRLATEIRKREKRAVQDYIDKQNKKESIVDSRADSLEKRIAELEKRFSVMRQRLQDVGELLS